MKYNDISNREAPIIAFNLDNLLYEEKSKSLFDIFKPRKLNQNFLDIVNNIWYNFEFSIYLVSGELTSDTFTRVEDIDIQFTNAIHYTGIDNLRRMIQYRFHLYVDGDNELISKLSAKNVIHIDDIYNHLRISSVRR
jgi:hypothetical protein